MNPIIWIYGKRYSTRLSISYTKVWLRLLYYCRKGFKTLPGIKVALQFNTKRIDGESMRFKLNELNAGRINPKPLSAFLMILLRTKLSHIIVGFILIIAFSGCSGEESEEEVTKQVNESSEAGDNDETAIKTKSKPYDFIKICFYL